MRLDRLLDLRKEKNLYKKQVASKINISSRRYSHYENGTRNIPTDILKDLALLYDTSTDYLLGLTDLRKPYPRSKKNNHQ